MSKLVLKKISKSYGDNSVIDDFSLDINPSEFIVLLGPSGSGKSTLIRIIAGLIEANSGQIYYGSNLISNKLPSDRDIAMVFQNYALYPHKSVFQNIAFPLELTSMLKEEIEAKVKKVAKNLGLHELLDRKPKELSGGQRQRVAVARAIVKEPKIYLMDEPLSNLDAKLRVQLRNEIAQLHKETGAIFIYVTHDQVEALTLADRIVVLNEAKVQQIASPKDLYQKPANEFVAKFIGSPAANIITNKDADRFGLRPEFLSLELKTKKLQVKFKRYELLGSEYLIYFELDDAEYSSESDLIMKLNHFDTSLEPSEVYFEPGEIYKF